MSYFTKWSRASSCGLLQIMTVALFFMMLLNVSCAKDRKAGQDVREVEDTGYFAVGEIEGFELGEDHKYHYRFISTKQESMTLLGQQVKFDPNKEIVVSEDKDVKAGFLAKKFSYKNNFASITVPKGIEVYYDAKKDISYFLLKDNEATRIKGKDFAYFATKMLYVLSDKTIDSTVAKQTEFERDNEKIILLKGDSLFISNEEGLDADYYSYSYREEIKKEAFDGFDVMDIEALEALFQTEYEDADKKQPIVGVRYFSGAKYVAHLQYGEYGITLEDREVADVEKVVQQVRRDSLKNRIDIFEQSFRIPIDIKEPIKEDTGVLEIFIPDSEVVNFNEIIEAKSALYVFFMMGDFSDITAEGSAIGVYVLSEEDYKKMNL